MMLDERGWTRDQNELDRLRLLEWISLHHGEIFSGLAELPFGHDDDALKADLSNLESSGFIGINTGMMSVRGESAFLTDHGRAHLREVDGRRANRVQRVEAARDALLDWYWDAKQDGDDVPARVTPAENPRAYFWGDPFTGAEQDTALVGLFERGLVDGPQLANGNIQWARITAKGEAIVEQHDSSIRAASSQNGGSSSTEFNTHFHGDVNGPVAIQGNATQTNNSGVPLEALIAALDAVREAAADLDEGTRATVFSYADVIQAESGMDEPDSDLMSKGLARLSALGAKSGNAALSSSIGSVVNALASAFGIG